MWCRYKKLFDSFRVSPLYQQQRFARNRRFRVSKSNKSREDPPELIPFGTNPGDEIIDNSVGLPKSTEPPKAKLTKLLDNAATFDDYRIEREVQRQRHSRLPGSNLPTEDPFMSTPYTKETKIFNTGNSALDEAERRKIVDPSSTSVVLFPGQGTQYVGMAGEEPELQLFTIASEILGYDLLKLCQKGPIQQLNQTVYSQPAILVCSLSAIEKLERKQPIVIESSVGAAGFSVGEYAALVYGGVISFEDAVRLIKVRSEAMQIACDEVKSQMATILYGADSRLGFALQVAKEWASREYKIENPVCEVTSYLFPHGKVIGGHTECIQFIQKNYADFKLRKVKVLPVAGAFHTELMKPAQYAVKELLKDVIIQKPRLSVYSNVTGHRYHSEAEVRRELPKQIVRPVMWEQTMHTIFHRPKDLPYPMTYEVGPGKSLLSILKYANARAQANSFSIQP